MNLLFSSLMDNSNNYPSLPSNMYLAQQQNAYYNNNNSYVNNPNANFNPNTSQTPNYYNHYQNQKKNNVNSRNSHLDTNQYQFLTATSSLLSSSSLCSSSTSLSGGGRRSVGGSGSCMDYHSLNHSLQPQQLQTQLSQERKKKPTLLRKLSEKRARGYELQQHFQQQQQSLVNNNNNPYHCSSSSSSSSSLNNSFNGNVNTTQSCNKNSNTACAQKNQSNSKVNNSNSCNASNQASCSSCSRRNMSTSDLHLSLYANSNNASIPASSSSSSSNAKRISANKSGNCFNSSSSNSTASSSPINSVPNSPASTKVAVEPFESSKSEKMLKKTISDPLAAVSLAESSDSDEAHSQSKSMLTNVNTCRGTGALDDELAAFIDDQSAQSLLNSTHHFQSINIPALAEPKAAVTAESESDKQQADVLQPATNKHDLRLPLTSTAQTASSFLPPPPPPPPAAFTTNSKLSSFKTINNKNSQKLNESTQIQSAQQQQHLCPSPLALSDGLAITYGNSNLTQTFKPSAFTSSLSNFTSNNDLQTCEVLTQPNDDFNLEKSPELKE